MKSDRPLPYPVEQENPSSQREISVNADSAVSLMNPIVLAGVGKEAFLKLAERPARPNPRLLSALRKF